MTELRDVAKRVLTARQRAMLARDTVKEYEQENQRIYTERTAANAELSDAEQAARNARLEHFFASGEQGSIYGLSVRKTMVPEYDDAAGCAWLVHMIEDEHNDRALYWLAEALDKHRPAFEQLLKEYAPTWLRWKRKVTATVAGDGLAAAIHSSADDEARGAESADDAIADTAQRLAGRQQ